MLPRRKECNAAFGVVLKRMDLSTCRRCGPTALTSKGTGTSVLRRFVWIFVNSHHMLGRLPRPGVLPGDVGMPRFGGMWRSGFGRVRLVLGYIRMRDYLSKAHKGKER